MSGGETDGNTMVCHRTAPADLLNILISNKCKIFELIRLSFREDSMFVKREVTIKK